MAVTPVQMNIDTKTKLPSQKKKEVKSYLEAEGTISTNELVHPLPPQGHLIHDNMSNSVKYFFKDIGYDMKSVKNGILGTANDHQSGRLNDVGLSLAGILIATYLASKTNNPKARIMEYVGLGSFLTAMTIYPKIAINAPARIIHGFDIDKEYIDDQGRKKSVMQDSNYVPYDMYRGDVPDENLSAIGDKMGIPRGIKNRNDLIREQMRKNATQSQTLWMLTAGITPALAGLMCYGLENYVVSPALEKTRIAKYDKLTTKALNTTRSMTEDVKTINPNNLSKQVKSLLSIYKGLELPKEGFDNLIQILTEDLFDNTAQGVKEDIAKILKTSASKGSESVIISEDVIKEMHISAQNTISMIHKGSLDNILIPTKEELKNILTNYIPQKSDLIEGVATKEENIIKIKAELRNLIDSKIKNSSGIPKEFLESQRNEVLNNITKILKTKKSYFVSDDSIKQIVDFAKVLGEFKENQRLIRKCKDFNIEHTDETIIARSYNKFEKTLIKELGIKFGELKKMRESDEYTKELLDKRFSEICKDESKYEKALKKLGEVISDMEVKLNGNDEIKSRLLDLINATENNYNNTAKRLSKLGNFDATINRLVKQDVESLGNNLTSREELYDFLDGIVENKYKDCFDGKQWWEITDEQRLAYLKDNIKGVGSSKNLEISRTVERYQGAKNSFHRILHTFDVYKRALTPEKFAENLIGKNSEYIDAIIKHGKEALLYASGPDHTMKLDTVNNPNFYKDLMNSVWSGEAGEFWTTKQKGLINESTKKVLGDNNTIAKGNLLDRFQYYITRFRNIVGNNDIDFTKPYHILNNKIRNLYTGNEKTRMAFFNLVGQTPVDMMKGAASRKYSTQKWLRIISAITGSVFGIAIISQYFFGKIKNPHNIIQKQVTNDASK